MRLKITLAMLLLGFATTASRVAASQVQGHLYTARAMSMQNPELESYLVGKREAAFRWGAVAPDTLWITYIRTCPYKAMALGLMNENMTQHPGLTSLNDTHNEPGGKSLDLCLAMMREASNPYEGAYALGWVTHWITDSYVHDLINTWGGCFDAPGMEMFRHKALEALECKHVLSAHADVVKSRAGYSFLPPEEYDAQVGASGHWATNLVLKAYQATFPDNTNYTAGADAFIKAFAIDEKLVQKASCWFYKEASFKTITEQVEVKAGRSAEEKGLIRDLVDLPTADVYQQILNPFALVVTTADGKLNIQIDVADNKMYGRFLLEWEESTKAAIEKSKSIIPACVKYIKAHAVYKRDPAKEKELEEDLQAIGKMLTDINPNREMDRPCQDYAQRRPLNISFKGSETSQLYFFTNLFWDCEVMGAAGGAPTRKERLNMPLNPTRNHSAAEIQEAINNIVLIPARGVISEPIPGGKSDSTCKVTVYTSTNRLKEKVDYAVSGGEASATQGEVMLGDIFDVQVQLPPGATGNSGTKRWLVVGENDRFFYNDLPMIRDSGLERVPKMYGKFRLDGRTIEQQTWGDTLSARVQFTSMSVTSLLGHQTLTLVCIPDNVGTVNQAMEVDKKWTIQSGTNLTSAQASQVLRMADTFKEQMKGKGLTSLEETTLLLERYIIFKKSIGVDVGPLDMRQLATTRPIVLVPPLLQYRIPAGWKILEPVCGEGKLPMYLDSYIGGRLTCSLGKEEEVKSSNNKDVIMRFSAELNGGFGNDPQIEAYVKGKWDPPARTYKLTTANGFTGEIREKREDKTETTKVIDTSTSVQSEGNLSINISGGGLLKKGELYLCVNYSMRGSADKLVLFENQKYDDKHELIAVDRRDIGDGRDQLKQKLTSAIADSYAVLAGFKLVKDPAFKLQPSRLFVPGPVSDTTVSANGETPAAPGAAPAGDAEVKTPGSDVPGGAPSPSETTIPDASTGSKPSKHPAAPSTDQDVAGGANSSLAAQVAPGEDAKPSVPVKPASASLELLTTKVASGDVLKVRIVNPPAEKFAWIGFYKKDAGHKDYIKYTFLNNLDNNIYEDVIAPDEEGEYNFRVFRDESYNPLATTDTIEVKARP